MATSTDELRAKAHASLSELIDGLTDNNVAAQLYRDLFMQSSVESLGANPEPTFDEVACFGAFCIAVNSTQYIRKRSFFGGDKPNEAAAKLFSDYLLEHLTGVLNSRPSRDSYLFYLQYEDPNASPQSHPFVEFTSLTPNMAAFQTRFIDYKFKVPVFATRLARVIQDSIRDQATRSVWPADFLPFGRQMAEITADIAKDVFSR